MTQPVMVVRQSDLKTWQRCPLQWAHEHVYGLPREQGGASVFGSVMHECVMLMEEKQDLDVGLNRFRQMWADPANPVTGLGAEGRIDYWEKGRSYKKSAEEGERILHDWWQIIRWETDVVLAREHTFEVNIGDGHRLRGTVDKLVLRFNPKLNTRVLLVSDYKTANKRPTYDYLEDDLQFTAYGYASYDREFWDGIPNADQLHQDTLDLPRWGEWVHLKGPMRLDAGVRTPVHFNRLIMAVNAFALSVDLRIFVPNISGESCKYCAHRKQCGLPEREDDD